MPDLSDWITATEVAGLIHVSTERVRQLAARETDPLPSIATPLGRLFWPSEVIDWQATREARGHVAPPPEKRGRRAHNAVPATHKRSVA